VTLTHAGHIIVGAMSFGAIVVICVFLMEWFEDKARHVRVKEQ
jgi:hypothetical protein